MFRQSFVDEQLSPPLGKKGEINWKSLELSLVDDFLGRVQFIIYV